MGQAKTEKQKTFEKATEVVMGLPKDDQLRLLRTLEDSIYPPDSESERLLVEELDRRWREIEDGTARLYTMDEAVAKVNAFLDARATNSSRGS